MEESKLEVEGLPRVAQRIHLACKKCQCERFFIVIAHATKTSAKVECEVCKSKKTYKLPSAKKKTTRKRATRHLAAEKQARRYSELKEQFGAGEVVSYKMTGQFELNTAINHPKFGVGFVTEVSGRAIQVTFEDVDRALVHNYP